MRLLLLLDASDLNFSNTLSKVERVASKDLSGIFSFFQLSEDYFRTLHKEGKGNDVCVCRKMIKLLFLYTEEEHDKTKSAYRPRPLE